MKSCKSEVNIWYLDDGTVCGDPKTVHEDLTRILEASNPLGLSVNSGKHEIFTIPGDGREEIQSDTQRVLENIQEDMPRTRMVNKNNLLLLGVPICEKAIEGVLLEKLQDLKRCSISPQELLCNSQAYLFFGKCPHLQNHGKTPRI